MKKESKAENREPRAGKDKPRDSVSPPPPEVKPSILLIILRWFFSRTIRQATAMRRHVHKILNAQSDILSPQAIDAVSGAMRDLHGTIAENADKPALQKQMENLEKVANTSLKPYPHAAWRENVEVLLVALAVAMGIRTFFLQPFKIPTGSMQPTLFGVTPSPNSPSSGNQPDLKIPGRLERLVDYWVRGNSYYHEVALEDGKLEAVKPPKRVLLFNLKQDYSFNNKWYSIWFPADNVFERAGYYVDPNSGEVLNSRLFRQGEDILRLKIMSGDHLFVDRVTYNFRHPTRGEIVVFETKGIYYPGMPQDQFYIKRLVGLGGEKLKLKKDYDVTNVPGMGTVPVGHLVVDGRELSAHTPHFENLYSFSNPPRNSTSLPLHENRYYGHAMLRGLAPGEEFPVRPNHCFVMGDNTMNSSDSRYWGDFAREQVIGKSFFVYWPITSRFGWGYR